MVVETYYGVTRGMLLEKFNVIRVSHSMYEVDNKVCYIFMDVLF